MRSLLILGAGQYGTVVKEIADAMNCFTKIDFLDDRNPQAIGKLCESSFFVKEYTDAIVAIDDLMLRIEYQKKLKEDGYFIPRLIHPTAYVSPSASVGEGSIVEPHARIHTNCIIGNGCYIAMSANVNHHTYVGDYCFIACNSTIMQNTYVKAYTRTTSGQLYFTEPWKREVSADNREFSFESGM